MSRSPSEMMHLALEVASSGSSNELPIGAIIVDSSGLVIASSRNAVIGRSRVTAHAELLAIEDVDLKRLRTDAEQMSLVATLEPCPMCAWAIRSSGFGRLIFGAYNPLYGAAGSVYDLLRDKRHGRTVEVVGGVLEEECRLLLADAFSEIRNNGSR